MNYSSIATSSTLMPSAPASLGFAGKSPVLPTAAPSAISIPSKSLLSAESISGSKDTSLFSFLLPQIYHCDFGDDRLLYRFAMIINTFVTGDSSSSLPNLFKDCHALQGLYRFVNNDSVSHAQLLEGYQDGLVELCGLESSESSCSTPDTSNRYYALFDTTYGMFNARKKLELGYIETKKDNGMVIHNGLLTNSQYEPLGLVHQEIILRDRLEYGKSKNRQKRPFEEKESYKWVAGFRTLEEFIGRTSCEVVSVLDREGDVKEVINAALAIEQLEFVIRSQHNRKSYLPILDENGEETEHITKLWDEMRQTSEQTKIIERELRNDKGKSYAAKCELKYKTIQLNDIDTAIQVVYLRELNPPFGEDAAEWLLLTSLEVENFEQAEEIVEIYTKRWAVEDFHKCLKTGCSFEQRQFDSPKAIANILAILSLVAVFLLRLRHLAKNHGEQDLSKLFQSPIRPFIKHIAPIYLKAKDLKHCQVDSVKWFCLLLGRMGGHQGVATKGLPGWQCLWKGWVFLQHLLTGYGFGVEIAKENS